MYISGGIQVRIVQWANYTCNFGRACDISVRSIVEHEKCNLRQLQLPAKWCGYRNRSPDLESLLSDYNDMLQRREMGESMNRCAWVQKMVSLMRMGFRSIPVISVLKISAMIQLLKLGKPMRAIKRSVGAFMSVIMYVFLRD